MTPEPDSEAFRASMVLPILKDIWGYGALRPGQREAIAAWSQGREVVALLPTGGGKSMCFQLPALIERQLGGGTTLVISPLIALMQDQVDSLMGRGVKAAALNSHLSGYEQDEVVAALEADLLDVLFVSPERAAQPRFRKLLSECKIAMIAVDEAHCVSSWGHDFRPEYMRIGELRDVVDVPMMALTATATPRVVREIISGLQLREPEVIYGDFARPNLQFSVRLESSSDTRMAIVADILDQHNMRDTSASPGRAILYCASRKKCESVAAELRGANFRVGIYHAGRSQDERTKAQTAFEVGRTRVLVATNAFGMGIDYPDVRVIIHVQSPGSVEAYYQEAGRASRDGAPGHCVLFFSQGDMMLQRRLIRGSSNGHRSNEALQLMEGYAMATECRQRLLCVHFDPDARVDDCGVCDVCTDGEGVMTNVASANLPKGQPLGTFEQDIIVAAVGHLKKPVGKSSMAKALRGSKAKALRKYGLQNLPEHGDLKECLEVDIIATMEQLLRHGRLAPKGIKYPTLWIPGKPVRAGTTKTTATQRGTTKKASYPKVSNLRRALELYTKRTAKKLSWKPYMVLHKKVILQLEEKRPKTIEELLELDGVGPAKADRFGWELLDIVRRYP